jgi:hypothetical protein
MIKTRDGMTSNLELLEMELLVFFKKSLIKYIRIEHHLGFSKQFLSNSRFSYEEVILALNSLLNKGYLKQQGNLLFLTDLGSDKSCENLEKNS